MKFVRNERNVNDAVGKATEKLSFSKMFPKARSVKPFGLIILVFVNYKFDVTFKKKVDKRP